MTSSIQQTDPYAELDYRADAAELSDGLRKPAAINRTRRGVDRSAFPMPRRKAVRIGHLG